MLLTLLSTMLFALPVHPESGPDLVPGPWRTWLDCPGGELPFGLELEAGEAGEWRAFILNGSERIAIPRIELSGWELLLEIDHYDSRLRATISDDGRRLDGEWKKRRGKHRWGVMPFHATAGDTPRFTPLEGAKRSIPVAGRWAVHFESDVSPAVALLASGPAGTTVTGTILTTIGDYRYLAGSIEGGRLRLSVFDGAHAFLFDARFQGDGTLSGDFWSGTSWHEEWTGRRDDSAELGDAFAQTTWTSGASLADLVLPDLDGRPRSLVDREFEGKAVLLQLFGSWCPNCHDETRYLTELHERYAAKGLSILALAFELTGDPERDTGQLRIFAERHGVSYPILLAGTADKSAASLAFPLIDRVRSYPTTVFFHGDGRLHSVHTGYAGPATGEAHERLRARFEATIEELLAESPASGEAAWSELCEQRWYSRVEFAGAAYDFELSGDGSRTAVYTVFGSGRPVISKETLPVHLRGDAVWIGETLYRFDRNARVLQLPTRFGSRLTPDFFSGSVYLEGLGYEGEAGFARALSDRDARVRREAIFHLVHLRAPEAGSAVPEVEPLLRDPDLGVRRAAVWAFAFCQDPRGVAAILELRTHPNAALRREVAEALVRMSKADPELRSSLEPLAADPDPIVRRRAAEGR